MTSSTNVTCRWINVRHIVNVLIQYYAHKFKTWYLNLFRTEIVAEQERIQHDRTRLKLSKLEFCVNNIQLTQWSRGLPEKLTRPNLLKKFPVFYETRRFITVLTRTPPPVPILSQICPVYASPTNLSKIHSNIMLPSTVNNIYKLILYVIEGGLCFIKKSDG